MALNLGRLKPEQRERVLWSTIVFVVALAVRTFHLIQLRTAPFFPFKLGDAEIYDAWARRIASGDWLGDGVFYQAPLYPYFLGSIYSLLGDDVMTVRKCQALIGAASCVLLANAGWRLFSKPAGILAGLMLALYAPAIFFDGLVQKSVLDLFFLCLMLWLLSILIDEPNRRCSFALGLTLGALVLTRENAVVLVIPILLWMFLERAAWVSESRLALRQRLSHASVFLVGLAVLLLPVAVRNQVVGGEFHLTTSQLGPNFYIGNNPNADGTYQPLQVGHGHARHEQSDATRMAEQALGRRLSAREVSSYYLGQSFRFLSSQPADWLWLTARKFALTLNTAELTDSEDLYTYARWSIPLQASGYVGHFGLLVPLALLGVFATWHERRKLWLLYLMLFFFAASVVIFFVFARYRFPLVPLLILFAAAGMAGGWRFWRGSPVIHSMACGAAILAVAVFSNWPLVSIEPMRATTHNNIGNALARNGRLDEAMAEYETALKIQPTHALAHHNLGVVLMYRGEIDAAIVHYEEALRIESDYPDARKHLEAARKMRSVGTAGNES